MLGAQIGNDPVVNFRLSVTQDLAPILALEANIFLVAEIVIALADKCTLLDAIAAGKRSSVVEAAWFG